MLDEKAENANGKAKEIASFDAVQKIKTGGDFKEQKAISQIA